jgi:2,4-dienoyl-CoA reductase-like NADH-dependent reductase (Old Yellow Enzyme family)
MTKITDEFILRGNRIKNRIVMPPMYTFSFRGENGTFFGRQHIDHYTLRAKGGAGLIILQSTRVHGSIEGTKLWSPENTAVLKQIVDGCHAYGALTFLQLSCDDRDINELSGEEIHTIQREIKQAAKSACALGFDGVEFHCAHSFFLCKFLDGDFNKRTDIYGGSAENRARILTEIIPGIRANTHEKFILGVRMGKFLPDEKDGFEAAKVFEKAGVDILHISWGMRMPAGQVPKDFICSYMTYNAYEMRRNVSLPVIAVNEITTERQVRFLIENKYADFAAVGRGMLADADFANHVIDSVPVNKCCRCGGGVNKCFWFSDHRLCPARNK